MKRYISFFSILLFVLNCYIIFAETPGKYTNYKVKQGDSLVKISEKFYLNGSNNNDGKISKKWILIYDTNKNTLPKIEITGFNLDAYVKLNIGQELRIPPISINQTQKVINETLNRHLKKAIEQHYEQYLANNYKEEIKNHKTPLEFIYSENKSGKLKINKEFYGSDIKLTDGTIIPSTCINDYNLFPYRIIQNPDAKKTIFIFPESHTDFGSNRYDKYLLLNSIADYNNIKNFHVFLESMDSEFDKERYFDNYEKLKNKIDSSIIPIKKFDILCSEYKSFRDSSKFRAAINPSMLFFYTKKTCTISGSEKYSSIKKFEDELNNLFKNIKTNNAIEINRLIKELIRERDNDISQSYERLPDNTIGLMDIGVAHTFNQLQLAKERTNYNLVVFYHPTLKQYEIGDKKNSKLYAHKQEPSEHTSVFENIAVISKPYKQKVYNPQNGKIIYQDFIEDILNKGTYTEEEKILIRIRAKELKEKEFFAKDRLLNKGEKYCNVFPIYGKGFLGRLRNGNKISFIFIPQNGLPEAYINDLVASDKIDSNDGYFFIKFWTSIPITKKDIYMKLKIAQQ